MHTRAQTRPVTVELWVRSLSPRGAGRLRSATIGRLERLAGDSIDGFRVRLWGDRIGHATPESRTDRGREVLERVAEFRAWADDEGLSLSPFFEQRPRESVLGHDGPERVQVLPEMAMAEFRAGELEWVTPCADEDRTYTVGEHLETLESGSPREETTPADAPATVPRGERP